MFHCITSFFHQIKKDVKEKKLIITEFHIIHALEREKLIKVER